MQEAEQLQHDSSDSKPGLLNFVLKLASNAFYMMGERIALVAILLIAAFLLSTQNSISVSAESKVDQPIVRPNAVTIEKEHIESPTVNVTFTPTPIKSEPSPTPKEDKVLAQAVTLTPTPIKSTITSVTPTHTPVEGVDYGSLNETEENSEDPSITPSPTVTPAPTSAPALAAAVSVDPGDNAIWEKLADCESHQNWSIDTGNGYYGGLQFSQGAWNSVGGSGNPAQASKDEQIMRGKMLQSQRGWGPWGGCSKKLGLL